MYMQCPYCEEDNTRVVETRESVRATRRRRECILCKQRFTTYERVETQQLRVIKKDGGRELFNREKLLQGIIVSCEKRPVTQEQIEQLVHEIEQDIRKKGDAEVQSTYIGEIVMKRLQDIDQVAYIRFASVYKQFTDVKSFQEEIATLRKK